MSEKTKPELWNKLAPILLVITIGLAFLVGVLWQKVVNLEKLNPNKEVAGTEETVVAATALSEEALKKYAQELGLDTEQFNNCLDEGKHAEAVKNDAKGGEEIEINGTPTFVLNGLIVNGAQPFSVFQDTIEYELEKGSWQNPAEKVKYLVDNSLILTERVKVEIGDAPSKGKESAPITIVEYSDFECPFCTRFFDETLPQVLKEYVETGKVRFVYKHYPLTFHEFAQKAAEAAMCAQEQNKFWEYHDKLFQAQL